MVFASPRHTFKKLYRKLYLTGVEIVTGPNPLAEPITIPMSFPPTSFVALSNSALPDERETLQPAILPDVSRRIRSVAIPSSPIRLARLG